MIEELELRTSLQRRRRRGRFTPQLNPRVKHQLRPEDLPFCVLLPQPVVGSFGLKRKRDSRILRCERSFKVRQLIIVVVFILLQR